MFIARLWERVRSNLFYVPMVFGLAGLALSFGALWADGRVEGLPDELTATVDSARAVLGVIAGATLSFAGIAFSVSLLLISAASSQYSPRLVRGLFRDPFNKRVMGVVVGTFIYCLMVMRSVRGPLEEGGAATVPSISVLIALVLGVVSIFAILAFINHSAHAMEVSTMLHRVTREALERVRVSLDDDESIERHVPDAAADWTEVSFTEHGWVQTVDHERILETIAPGTTVELLTVAGRYALPQTPICRVAPPPQDLERIENAIRAAVGVGESRTLQQDVEYGVRQLADVALKALSPGINDPTTAQDALFHMAAVVGEILRGPRLGRHHAGEEGRLVVSTQTPTYAETVGLAFNEVRIASVGQPTVQVYLLEILRLLADSLDPVRRADARTALRDQAKLVLAMSELGELPDEDRARVEAAFQKRFGEQAAERR